VKYFSGKVNQVSYQPHSADAFYHQYSYDAYPPGETPVVRKVMAGYFCLKKMMAKNESVREEIGNGAGSPRKRGAVSSVLPITFSITGTVSIVNRRLSHQPIRILSASPLELGLRLQPVK